MRESKSSSLRAVAYHYFGSNGYYSHEKGEWVNLGEWRPGYFHAWEQQEDGMSALVEDVAHGTIHRTESGLILFLDDRVGGIRPFFWGGRKVASWEGLTTPELDGVYIW